MIVHAERDIWESACQLIEQHEHLAVIEASKMADHYLDIGDIDMQRIWLRIVRAIIAVKDTEGKSMH